MTREQAIKIIEQAKAVVLNNGEYDKAMSMAIEALQELPKRRKEAKRWKTKALQAEPVKHGEWKYGEGRQEGWLVCCECGDAFDVIKRKENIHYCPNCGAKMDG